MLVTKMANVATTSERKESQVSLSPYWNVLHGS